MSAHAAELAQAQYVAQGLRSLSSELHRLLDVVVLAAEPRQGVLSSADRRGELEAVLSLLEELSGVAASAMQRELASLVTLVRAALPHLVLFAPGLDALQEAAAQALGPNAVHLLGWAWQRRAILGPSRLALLADLAGECRPFAQGLGGGRAGQQCRRELAQCLASLLGGSSAALDGDAGSGSFLAQSAHR